MAIKNYTFLSPNGTEFPVSATADRRLYLMLSGMDYSAFKMSHWVSTTNTALNHVYVDSSFIVGGAYFELKSHAITLKSNSINFIHVNIDLSNTSSPVSLSVETKDNSNNADMNTTSSVLKKCIEVVTTSGTEVISVSSKPYIDETKEVAWTGSLTAGSAIYTNFSKYNKLKFYGVLQNRTQFTIEIDLTMPLTATELTNRPFVGNVTIGSYAEGSLSREWKLAIGLADDKINAFLEAKYRDGAGNWTNVVGISTFVYKIEGVY